MEAGQLKPRGRGDVGPGPGAGVCVASEGLFPGMGEEDLGEAGLGLHVRAIADEEEAGEEEQRRKEFCHEFEGPLTPL